MSIFVLSGSAGLLFDGAFSLGVSLRLRTLEDLESLNCFQLKASNQPKKLQKINCKTFFTKNYHSLFHEIV